MQFKVKEQKEILINNTDRKKKDLKIGVLPISSLSTKMRNNLIGSNKYKNVTMGVTPSAFLNNGTKFFIYHSVDIFILQFENMRNQATLNHIPDHTYFSYNAILYSIKFFNITKNETSVKILK